MNLDVSQFHVPTCWWLSLPARNPSPRVWLLPEVWKSNWHGRKGLRLRVQGLVVNAFPINISTMYGRTSCSTASPFRIVQASPPHTPPNSLDSNLRPILGRGIYIGPSFGDFVLLGRVWCTGRWFCKIMAPAHATYATISQNGQAPRCSWGSFNVCSHCVWQAQAGRCQHGQSSVWRGEGVKGLNTLDPQLYIVCWVRVLAAGLSHREVG